LDRGFGVIGVYSFIPPGRMASNFGAPVAEERVEITAPVNDFTANFSLPERFADDASKQSLQLFGCAK
jgi:hypothetical protein